MVNILLVVVLVEFASEKRGTPEYCKWGVFMNEGKLNAWAKDSATILERDTDSYARDPSAEDQPHQPAFHLRERLGPSRPGISRTLTNLPESEAIFATAKQAFSTRMVDPDKFGSIITGPLRPMAGDLVAAEVVSLGYQRRIELTDGRKAKLKVGDVIIAAYGARYATDQYEAEVPCDLRRTNLVATGGVVAQMLSRNSSIRTASAVQPLGLVASATGQILNLRQFSAAHAHSGKIDEQVPVIAVLGTAMNSGKTTTNQSLLRGLRAAGLNAAVIKVTGTASGGDYWQMIDSGAHFVADFTDAGYSSTYKLPLIEIEEICVDLAARARASGADVVLLEVADGILQEQNTELLKSETFRELVSRMVFAASEPMGALMGVRLLQEMELPLVAASGRFTGSNLAVREFSTANSLPVYSISDLEDPEQASALAFGDMLDRAESPEERCASMNDAAKAPQDRYDFERILSLAGDND